MTDTDTTGLLGTLSADERRRLRAARPGVELADRPMLATLSDRRDFPGGWIFERKLDGVRVLAVREGGRVLLLSRTGRRLNDTYPEIVEALDEQSCTDFTVDGEIVAFAHGRTDFARLQRRMGLTRRREIEATGVDVTYYLFDLLRLEGTDTTQLPLRTRKSLLRRALTFRSPLRMSTHRNAGGPELLAEACAHGWEGLIAKRADSRYQPRRSPDWLKLKCSQGQEFVVAGFTEPAKQPRRVRCAAARLLRRRQAALRGQGGHGLRPSHPGRTTGAPGRTPHLRLAVRRPGTGAAYPLGGTGAGRAGRVHRVDAGRHAAASAVPRAAGRQGGA